MQLIKMITENITEVLAIGTTVGAYFFGRRKQNAEINGLETKTVSDNLGLYQKMIDDLEKRYTANIKDLSDKIEELQKQVDECKKKH